MIIITVIFVPCFSSANLQSDIDEMFQKFGFKSSTGLPGVYMSQSMGYLTPGSLNIRANVSGHPIVTLNPPRFKAGCGGIDMFFGGVGFINKQEFINLAKTIGQNAIGYAFHLALKQISPTIEGLIQDLQSYINKLNKISTDTCNTAQTLVNWSLGSRQQQLQTDCAKYRENQFGEDKDTAWQTCTQDGAVNYVKEMWNDLTGDPSTYAKNTVPSSPSPGNTATQTLKWVYNFTGDDKNIAASLVGVFRRCTGNGNGLTNEEYLPPLISFKDFWFGKENAEVYDVPEDPLECEIGKKTITIPGFRMKVMETLNRIATARINGQQPTDEDKNFIEAATIPVYALIDKIKSSPAMVNASLELFADVISVDMAYATVQRYVRATMINAGKQHIIEPGKFVESIRGIENNLLLETNNAIQVFILRARAIEITKLYIEQVGKDSTFSGFKNLLR
jgi:hypothetical protein